MAYDQPITSMVPNLFVYCDFILYFLLVSDGFKMASTVAVMMRFGAPALISNRLKT